MNATAAPGASAADAGDATRIARAWEALHGVEDPEIPGLTLLELGVIRYVTTRPDDTLEVGLSPTYTGCPATHVIRDLVGRALGAAQLGHWKVDGVLAPAWSSDWITPEGRRKLAEYGIAPPVRASSLRDWRASRPVACPRCQSLETETLSEFGSTPCKALHRCRACREPFEYFKCI